jgi:hypothetical protein
MNGKTLNLFTDIFTKTEEQDTPVQNHGADCSSDFFFDPDVSSQQEQTGSKGSRVLADGSLGRSLQGG